MHGAVTHVTSLSWQPGSWFSDNLLPPELELWLPGQVVVPIAPSMGGRGGACPLLPSWPGLGSPRFTFLLALYNGVSG